METLRTVVEVEDTDATKSTKHMEFLMSNIFRFLILVSIIITTITQLVCTAINNDINYLIPNMQTLCKWTVLISILLGLYICADINYREDVSRKYWIFGAICTVCAAVVSAEVVIVVFIPIIVAIIKGI